MKLKMEELLTLDKVAGLLYDLSRQPGPSTRRKAALDALKDRWIRRELRDAAGFMRDLLKEIQVDVRVQKTQVSVETSGE